MLSLFGYHNRIISLPKKPREHLCLNYAKYLMKSPRYFLSSCNWINIYFPLYNWTFPRIIQLSSPSLSIIWRLYLHIIAGLGISRRDQERTCVSIMSSFLIKSPRQLSSYNWTNICFAFSHWTLLKFNNHFLRFFYLFSSFAYHSRIFVSLPRRDQESTCVLDYVQVPSWNLPGILSSCN